MPTERMNEALRNVEDALSALGRIQSAWVEEQLAGWQRLERTILQQLAAERKANDKLRDERDVLKFALTENAEEETVSLAQRVKDLCIECDDLRARLEALCEAVSVARDWADEDMSPSEEGRLTTVSYVYVLLRDALAAARDAEQQAAGLQAKPLALGDAIVAARRDKKPESPAPEPSAPDVATRLTQEEAERRIVARLPGPISLWWHTDRYGVMVSVGKPGTPEDRQPLITVSDKTLSLALAKLVRRVEAEYPLLQAEPCEEESEL